MMVMGFMLLVVGKVLEDDILCGIVESYNVIVLEVVFVWFR